jgi:WD40 repeat protein
MPVNGPATFSSLPDAAVPASLTSSMSFTCTSPGLLTGSVVRGLTPNYVAGPHDSSVTAVAVGERQGRPVIVSGSWDYTVRVWDLESGEPALRPLTGHAGMVNMVAVFERHRLG